MQPILVTYGSKYGATAEIAERIARTLRDAALPVEILPAEQVDDLSRYSAYVIGSAVYAGQWRGEINTLLETHAAELSEKPVWLFSSGPTGEGDPSTLMKGYMYPEGLRPVIDRIRPRAIAFFHGVLDTGKLNFFERTLVKAMKAPTGDFRDWGMITNWANVIANGLKAEPA